ncbi:MAG: methylenetetrahydrofolate reductase [Spirochaetaceae bacterium]|jgi:methylenetetrahydrofolate reductase (NADPH)|nr:methylenetetrahydrofolate reductase [Spirochaetaceae bacterium]
MDVSLEIVPRSFLSLKEDFLLCRSYDAINCINFPDLTRFSIRSWEACASFPRDTGTDAAGAEAALPVLMPHLRARDFSPDAPFPLRGYFRKWNIRRVLVIAGDPPNDGGNKPGEDFFRYPPVLSRKCPEETATVVFIKKLRTEMPELEIYVAFDPYRTNIRYELDYLEQKEKAGAVGFMSQPFFDLRLLEIYAEYLEGKQVFWGVAPVLSMQSQAYWESRNRAVFPRSFRADITWNIDFAKRVFNFCGRNNFNLYLMPIKLNLKTYLRGIFG